MKTILVLHVCLQQLLVLYLRVAESTQVPVSTICKKKAVQTVIQTWVDDTVSLFLFLTYTQQTEFLFTDQLIYQPHIMQKKYFRFGYCMV